MGVYIKDMKLPTSCRKCMISQPDGCGWICPIIESKPIVDGRVNSRHPHCPLVLVSPHGRLGDLDALYSHIKDEQRKCNDPYDGWSECQVALGFVNTAPTIIPAEEDEP